MRWESARKKRVVLRIGYVGTDYRGFTHRLFNFRQGNGWHGALMECYCYVLGRTSKAARAWRGFE
jgi:hypothetical protein